MATTSGRYARLKTENGRQVTVGDLREFVRIPELPGDAKVTVFGDTIEANWEAGR